MLPNRWLILTAAVALNSPLASLAESPATLPSNPPVIKTNADDDGMRQIDWPTIATVVKLSMKDRMLAMTSDLPPDDELVRLKVADFSGKTVLLHKPNDQMLTVRHEFSFPPSTTVIYSMTANHANVNLSVDSEDGKELRSVQYIQNSNNVGGDETNAPVIFYVTVSELASGNKSVDLRLVADTAEELHRKYPRETVLYFQPLLAALRQDEVVFSVDHRKAWQVLQHHFAIDDVTATRMKRIVKELDNEEYATREAASEALEKMGEPAALVAMRMSRAGLSSEQNSRLETFLAAYKPLRETDAKAYANDPWFLFDCLTTEDRAIRTAALKQLEQVSKRAIDLSPDASPSAWKAGLRTLRKQLIATSTTKPTSRTATSASN